MSMEMRQHLLAILKEADTKGVPNGTLNQDEILNRLSKYYITNGMYHNHIRGGGEACSYIYTTLPHVCGATHTKRGSVPKCTVLRDADEHRGLFFLRIPFRN